MDNNCDFFVDAGRLPESKTPAVAAEHTETKKTVKRATKKGIQTKKGGQIKKAPVKPAAAGMAARNRSTVSSNTTDVALEETVDLLRVAIPAVNHRPSKLGSR